MAESIRRWCWRNSEDRRCRRPTSMMSVCCLTRFWAISRASSQGPSPGRRSSKSLNVEMHWKSEDAPLGNCRSHQDHVHAHDVFKVKYVKYAHAREAAAPVCSVKRTSWREMMSDDEGLVSLSNQQLDDCSNSGCNGDLRFVSLAFSLSHFSLFASICREHFIRNQFSHVRVFRACALADHL